jgi:3D (Asp-Asp-Asp) domain-containing protein
VPSRLIIVLLSCVVFAGCGQGAAAPRAQRAPTADPPSPRIAPAATRIADRHVDAHAARCVPPPVEHLITHRGWLSGVTITEYYPVPESWFNGLRVRAPGLPGRHRVDWLYSANGVSMEGDGIDLGGHRAHIADLGSVGWVNARGVATVPPDCGTRWTHGPPDWRAGGWRNGAGGVTYRLASGGWSNGAGHWVGDYGGATFALGPSLPLRYYHSVAVDPRLIPRGSRLYIPAYRAISGGWFVAQDTGGAIIGRHIDVFRPPTPQPFGSGRLLTGQRVYLIPPGK